MINKESITKLFENNTILIFFAAVCIIGFSFKVYTLIFPDFSILCAINSSSCIVGDHNKAIDIEQSILRDGGTLAFIIIGALSIIKLKNKF